MDGNPDHILKNGFCVMQRVVQLTGLLHILLQFGTVDFLVLLANQLLALLVTQHYKFNAPDRIIAPVYFFNSIFISITFKWIFLDFHTFE